MDGEEQKIGKLTKALTLGGPVRRNKENLWMYFGTSKQEAQKEKLFGKVGRGPLHPGIPYKHEVTLEATQSDTKATLIRELVEQSKFTKREAEEVVNEMLKNGTLREINHPELGRVLVFGGRR